MQYRDVTGLGANLEADIQRSEREGASKSRPQEESQGHMGPQIMAVTAVSRMKVLCGVFLEMMRSQHALHQTGRMCIGESLCGQLLK